MSEPQPEPDWLEERSRETRLLLQRQKVAAAQAGADVTDLVVIDRLESRLANRERIRRLRELTKRA